MIKVFDTKQEYEAYSQNGLANGELCYVAEDKTAHFKTTNLEDTPKEEDNNYIEFNISTSNVIRLDVVAGDSFEIYNPNHVKLMIYNTPVDEMFASSGVMSYSEHIYYTCDNQCVWAEQVIPAYFNVVLDPCLSGEYTIYYRKL